MVPLNIRYHHLMSGFVLAGGRSSRMGRDKTLLPVKGGTLIQQVAWSVLHAAGDVTIVAPPERYAALGSPVIADRLPGCGPLGGGFSSLSTPHSDWNLIAACDMPG